MNYSLYHLVTLKVTQVVQWHVIWTALDKIVNDKINGKFAKLNESRPAVLEFHGITNTNMIANRCIYRNQHHKCYNGQMDRQTIIITNVNLKQQAAARFEVSDTIDMTLHYSNNLHFTQ